MQDAVRNLPLDRLCGTTHDVLLGQECFPFRPAFDPLKQCSALVPSGLARRERRIEVNVRLDKRGCHETSSRINGFTGVRRQPGLNALKKTVHDADVDKQPVRTKPCVANNQIKHRLPPPAAAALPGSQTRHRTWSRTVDPTQAPDRGSPGLVVRRILPGISPCPPAYGTSFRLLCVPPSDAGWPARHLLQSLSHNDTQCDHIWDPPRSCASAVLANTPGTTERARWLG